MIIDENMYFMNEKTKLGVCKNFISSRFEIDIARSIVVCILAMKFYMFIVLGRNRAVHLHSILHPP